MKTAGILTIGNEILQGYTLDLNANRISAELTKRNINVTIQLTVPDSIQKISEKVEKFIQKDYDYVFIPITDYIQDVEQTKSISTKGEMKFIQPQKPINNRIAKDYKNVIKLAKKINSKRIIYIDYNMDAYRHPRWMMTSRYLAKVFARRDIYLYKPSELFHDVRRFIMKSPD